MGNLGLVLGNELIQETLPLLIGMAYPHPDSIDHALSGCFLDKWRDLHRNFGVLRELTRDRPPKNGDVDAISFEIPHHR